MNSMNDRAVCRTNVALHVGDHRILGVRCCSSKMKSHCLWSERNRNQCRLWLFFVTAGTITRRCSLLLFFTCSCCSKATVPTARAHCINLTSLGLQWERRMSLARSDSERHSTHKTIDVQFCKLSSQMQAANLKTTESLQNNMLQCSNHIPHLLRANCKSSLVNLCRTQRKVSKFQLCKLANTGQPNLDKNNTPWTFKCCCNCSWCDNYAANFLHLLNHGWSMSKLFDLMCNCVLARPCHNSKTETAVTQ